MELGYLADHPGFLDQLAWHHFREWSHLRPGETLAQRTGRLALNCGRRGLPTVIVAHQDGSLLGSAMLLPNEMATRPEWEPWLGGVFVVERFRGTGVGVALVRRAEAEASSLGFTRLYLYTPAREEWYARLGWQLLERCTYLGVPVSVMCTQLDQ